MVISYYCSSDVLSFKHACMCSIYTTHTAALTCCVCGAGPVLDETLFFPEVATLDTSTIFINWGLHADSIPASRYVLSIGLQSEGEGGLTLVPVLVPDPSNPPSRHQFSPVTHGMVYSIAIRAVDATNTSSPVTSVVWRVGEDIREGGEGGWEGWHDGDEIEEWDEICTVFLIPHPCTTPLFTHTPLSPGIVLTHAPHSSPIHYLHSSIHHITPPPPLAPMQCPLSPTSQHLAYHRLAQ